MNGFPTNGQAKELPTATWDRLWRDVPRTNVTVRSLPTQGRVTPNWVTTDTSTPFPDRKRPFSRDPENQQPQSNKFVVTT